MTPHQLNLAAQVFNEKQNLESEKHKLQFQENLVVAYYTALWQRVEKLSNENLKEVLDKVNGQQDSKKKQTPDEMFEEVKKLNAALGGTTY